ncbi:MAG: hypothetical protein ACRDQA_15730 [Nocardioidaceae bacterium]
MTSQIDQLMEVSATIEELTCTTFQQGAWNGTSSFDANLSHDYTSTLWTAPFTARITSFDVVREYGDTAANNTNFIKAELFRLNSAGVFDIITSKTTRNSDGEAMTHRTPWSFDGSVWHASHAVLAKGDTLQLSWSFGGNGQMRFPALLTFRYVPA